MPIPLFCNKHQIGVLQPHTPPEREVEMITELPKGRVLLVPKVSRGTIPLKALWINEGYGTGVLRWKKVL